MSIPIPNAEHQIADDIEQAARSDPGDTLRLIAIIVLAAVGLLTYLLVAAVNGHSPIADRYLSAIGLAVSPLLTFAIGVLVPSPLQRK